MQGRTHSVESIGYLVPARRFAATVHSVFDRACNLALDDTVLLSLCLPDAGEGPMTLRLACHPVPGLRQLFRTGEPVECRDAVMRSARARICMRQATTWRAPELATSLPVGPIFANLDWAAERLAQRRAERLNVLDREGAAPAAALRDACRGLDESQARRHAARLIGWGEGLTPAGDDFLAGLLAGLDAMARDDPRRRAFLRTLAACIVADAGRTTPIAAHFLRLAAAGHHGEPLCALRNALLGESRHDSVCAAFDAALAIGATSGADAVSGLLAGLGAWAPARRPAVHH